MKDFDEKFIQEIEKRQIKNSEKDIKEKSR